MQAIFFILFAFLTLLCGLLVVANPFSRNPVTSAMFLVLTIVSLAGLFVLLDAFFLGIVQIVVYAGAVMVLFLFVIMLLDLQAEQRRKMKKAMVALGVVSAGSLVSLFVKVILDWNPGVNLPPATLKGETIPLGQALFTQYLLPFEIVSVLLLMALELMLNAANLALVAFSRFNNNLNGQVMVLFIVTVAAAEVAVGLALIVALYRKRQSAHVEELTSLRL